ncbi:hypothetical protein [Streptomyces lydicamycinicus]
MDVNLMSVGVQVFAGVLAGVLLVALFATDPELRARAERLLSIIFRAG